MKETNFKQTDIGLIPEDWEIVDISSVVDNCCYGVGAEAVKYNGEVKYLRITDIDDESHAFVPKPLASPSFFDDDYFARKGDLFVARTGASVGKSYLYKECDGKLVYAGFLIKIHISNADPYYVFLNTLTKYYSNWILSESARTGQPGINAQQLKSFVFPIPPTIEEQERIANALSQVDDLLAALDEQIEKKQLVKQGTMQQLLTGKTRLQGFKGKWKTVKLGDVLDYEQPSNYQVLSTQYLEKGVPVLTAGKTFILGYTAEKTGVYNKLPVIIFDDFVAESKYVDFPFKVKSSAVKMLKLKKEKDSLRFVYEIMQIIDFVVADHKRHWISDYSLIEIKMPEPSEQQAIANILSTMDDEIQALQEERDKYALVKQGMMQQLLTGKIRLN